MTLKKRPTNDPPQHTNTHTHTHTHIFAGSGRTGSQKTNIQKGLSIKEGGGGPGQFANLMRARKKGIDIPMHTIVNVCSFSGFLRFGYMPEC